MVPTPYGDTGSPTLISSISTEQPTTYLSSHLDGYDTLTEYSNCSVKSSQYYIVPDNVDYLHILACGADGGPGSRPQYTGGKGGCIVVKVESPTIEAGYSLSVNVGCAGIAASSSLLQDNSYGWNWGGNGGYFDDTRYGGGGGGTSNIWIADSLIVAAGGGGGASANGNGGDGGTYNAIAAASSDAGCGSGANGFDGPTAQGGMPYQGGTGAVNTGLSIRGNDGGSIYGGSAYSGFDGGGGGGGYYGGGGGVVCGGGGGGSGSSETILSSTIGSNFNRDGYIAIAMYSKTSSSSTNLQRFIKTSFFQNIVAPVVVGVMLMTLGGLAKHYWNKRKPNVKFSKYLQNAANDANSRL
jgi:hypothetical protein